MGLWELKVSMVLESSCKFVTQGRNSLSCQTLQRNFKGPLKKEDKIGFLPTWKEVFFFYSYMFGSKDGNKREGFHISCLLIRHSFPSTFGRTDFGSRTTTTGLEGNRPTVPY